MPSRYTYWFPIHWESTKNYKHWSYSNLADHWLPHALLIHEEAGKPETPITID